MSVSEATTQSERQAFSSVEITKNAKGDYQWQIKCYVLPGDEQIALMRARMVDEQLRAQYAPEVKEETNDTNV